MIASRSLTTLLIGLAAAVTVFSAHRALTSRSGGSISAPAGATFKGTLEAASSADPSKARTGEPAAPPDGLDAGGLVAASESFRNTSLLIAIRDAGHVCVDVVGAAEGAGDAAVWRVSCSDAHAYLVTDDGSGRLIVEQLYYGDSLSLGPALLRDDANAIGERIELRAPQDLPQPLEPPTQ